MLTGATVKAARPRPRPYKIFDSGGLYLFVRPNGSRVFRMKYRFGGREKLLTFGAWPELDLGEARERRDRARELLGRGVDPSTELRTGPAGDEAASFEPLARRWHERRRMRWSAEHATDVLASFERDVFPATGASPLPAIDAPAVLELLLAIERRGRLETARRVRERISAVFRLGISLKLCSADPAALIVDELAPRPLQRPQPALLALEEARALLAAAERADAAPIVKLASRFLALTAVRMGALRGARWEEVEDLDGETPLWRIPPARMKLTKVKKADPSAEHPVPLSRQAVAVLRTVRVLSGGAHMILCGEHMILCGGAHKNMCGLIFPGARPGKPIGEGAIGDLYDRAGYARRHVPHGWRAAFSTILNDLFPEDQALIDQALGHVRKGKTKVEGAYNRARHLDRRRDLFQRWGDLLAPVLSGAEGPELLALPPPGSV